MRSAFPDQVISEDYLLTNRFYRRDPNSAAPTCPTTSGRCSDRCEASFLAAAFEAIDADYGDLESYFSDGLGLGAPERAESESALPAGVSC